MLRPISIALALTIVALPAIAAENVPSAPAWKQVYENSESIYYVRTNPAAPGVAQVEASSLIQFKIPEVLDGVQVWSIVSHMTLDCAGKRMVTVDNSSYAARMGAGRLIASQKTGDTWHAPASGSLGELIFDSGCGAK